MRLVLLDPALFSLAEVEPEQFSAPVLGKAFRLLRDRHDQGLSVQLASLAGELTPEEMSHLTSVVQRPESLANGQRAMADYIETIKAEAAQRCAPKSGNALLELRDRQRKTMVWLRR